MAEENRILREVEFQKLDLHHLSMNLLQRPTNAAIEGLLRCYGDVVRGLRNGSIPKNNDEQRHQTANEEFRGLAHCIRWVQANCPRRIYVPSPGEPQLQQEAMELLQWGVKYDPLVNQHTAYSRNRLVDAVVDEQDKSITFLPRTGINPQFYVSQVEAKKAEDLRQGKLYPEQVFAKLSTEWFQSVAPAASGFQFDDSKIATAGALDVAVNWLKESSLPELSDDCQLGTFTLGSFRRVLAAFHVASLFRVRLEDSSDQQTRDTNNRVPKRILSWESNDLVHWLEQITGVESDELNGVLQLLIFDDERPRVTLAHKPLVRGADNRVFLSPRLFFDLPISQMVIGSLNLSSTTRTAYDSVSTIIEKALLDKVSSEVTIGPLQNAQMVVDKTFNISGGKEITPDFVFLSEDQNELLVVDFKNATPPFGVGDIFNDLREWSEKWAPQINGYVEAFEHDPKILSQHFENVENATPKVFGLILLRWPFPLPVELPAGYAAIDWPTFKEYLSKNNSVSIEEMYKWIRDRPDIPVVRSLGWKEKQPIPVDDWTYTYSVLSPSVSDDENQSQ